MGKRRHLKDNELIKLGIAIDYPIDWDIEMVMRDLIQNFYDAIGSERFNKGFSYTISGSGIYDCIMESDETSFSYEWLTYIGGSTKTDSLGQYIGMYGEGFKMCMLTLVKMSVDSVIMESQDWKISPCVYDEKVADRVVRMLGYRYFERKDDSFTRLTIKGIPYGSLKGLQKIKYNFFYSSNPLFRKEIYKDENICLYERSNIHCPTIYYDRDFKGILYINGLARARLDVPLVINVKRSNAEEEHRNRENMFSFQAKRLLARYSMKMDPRSSYYMLIHLQEVWGDIPERHADVESWYFVVCNLVRNVSSSSYYKKLFKKRFKGLYYIDRPDTDRKKRKLIRETEIWMKSMIKTGQRRVNPIFRQLGAVSMIGEYQKKQQIQYRCLDDQENKRVEILFNAIETIIGLSELYDKRPDILIIDENAESRFTGRKPDPLQYAIRDYSRVNNRKYRIEKLLMKSEDIVSDDFIAIFLNFFELLCNSYGSERSKKRAYMLTDLGSKLIDNIDAIKKYEESWKNVGREARV